MIAQLASTLAVQDLPAHLIQHTVDALSLGSLYAMFALGIALIFGVMRLVNFAHGEMIMIAAYVTVVGSSLAFVPLAALMVGACVLAALVLERVAFRPVRGADPETLLVTSFAVSVFLQSLAEAVFGTTPESVSLLPQLNSTVVIGGIYLSTLNLTVLAVSSILLVSLTLFLNRTTIGVQMRAAAEDFRAARVLGVRANRVIAVAFALSGLLAAVAAIFLVTQQGSIQPRLGVSVALIAFVATVIGGMGSLIGAVAGGMALGIATIVLDVTLPLDLAPFRDAFLFSLVFLVLVFRPQGLVALRAHQTRI